jgi:3',5'-cyclic AMP phosphodiesterase CpdA
MHPTLVSSITLPPDALKMPMLISAHRGRFLAFSLTVAALLGFGQTAAVADSSPFRVRPYVQNPRPTAVVIRWLTESGTPGELHLETPAGPKRVRSQPIPATQLQTNPFGEEPGAPHPGIPFLHHVELSDLTPGTRYSYVVQQDGASADASFKTAPAADAPLRLVVYSDSETEPESSTSPPVDWPVGPGSNRPDGQTRYVVDQTTGYRENLQVMASREPDLVLVTGDLVESGGEQRDWDEFWKHNAGEYGTIASTVPLLPAIGNHENVGGPGKLGGYSAAAANFSVAKYLTYFSLPDNGAKNPRHRGRYYRFDYGPITLITLDSSDGLPANSEQDTNHNLTDSDAPDFNPGSEQYAWLEQELMSAQKTAKFTFVQFHHTAYGSGPHSVPFGAKGFSGQSGRALRVLQPILAKYGVDAVFSGHDEMIERSATTVTEQLPSGGTRERTLHFYDVGAGGDGLRGPAVGFDNPIRKFLAHDDSPEVWEGKRLVSGGKHYGHLEVNILPPSAPNAAWTATLIPVQIFPLMNAEGTVTGFERRIWNDEVTISQ